MRISAQIKDAYKVSAESTKEDAEIRERSKEEYKEMMAILTLFIDDFYDNPSLYITHTDLAEQRVRFVLTHAFEGYGMTFDQAIGIVANTETDLLSPAELEERTMLINMVDNLVNFSVAAEHQALLEMQSDRTDADDKEEFIAMAHGTFAKYNKTYAGTENADVHYAMSMALAWAAMDENEIIEFNTQGDERVRASHATLHGLRYRKNQFPAALVPPIDHSCRCFLLNLGSTDGRRLTNKSNSDELIATASNPTFKMNPATSGVIFSESHSYFTVEESFAKELAKTVRKIKIRLGL